MEAAEELMVAIRKTHRQGDGGSLPNQPLQATAKSTPRLSAKAFGSTQMNHKRQPKPAGSRRRGHALSLCHRPECGKRSAMKYASLATLLLGGWLLMLPEGDLSAPVHTWK
jgi:hypothetical protein